MSVSFDTRRLLHVQVFASARYRRWNDALRFIEVHSCGKRACTVAGAGSASSAPDSTESAESVLERFDFATGKMHTWEWKLQAWLLCGRLQSDFKHLRFTNGDRVVDVR